MPGRKRVNSKTKSSVKKGCKIPNKNLKKVSGGNEPTVFSTRKGLATRKGVSFPKL